MITIHTTGCDDSIEFLVVSITSIPRVFVLDVDIGFERLFDDEAFHEDPQMNGDEVWWNARASQEDHYRRHVSIRVAAVIVQIYICPGNSKTFL